MSRFVSNLKVSMACPKNWLLGLVGASLFAIAPVNVALAAVADTCVVATLESQVGQTLTGADFSFAAGETVTISVAATFPFGGTVTVSVDGPDGFVSVNSGSISVPANYSFPTGNAGVYDLIFIASVKPAQGNITFTVSAPSCGSESTTPTTSDSQAITDEAVGNSFIDGTFGSIDGLNDLPGFEGVDPRNNNPALGFSAQTTGDPFAKMGQVERAFMAFNAVDNGIGASGGVRGEGVDLWTRFKISKIDGKGGKSGVAGEGNVGFVAAATDALDIGAWVSFFGADIEVSSTTTDLDTVGGGIGAYMHYALSDTLKASIATSYKKSDNDIDIAGVTGSFDQEVYKVDAALTGMFYVDELMITPSFNIGWLRSERKAYTDSASAIVAKTVVEKTTASVGLTFARTYEADSDSIVSYTPNAGLSLSYSDKGDAYGAVGAGILWALNDGVTTDLTFDANGLGADDQAYSIGVRLLVPLN